jgi:predicted ATPase
MTLATEQGFAQIAACGTISRGWALAEQGKRAEGIRQMREGQAALRAMGAEAIQSWVLALLAEAHEKGGQAEEGLALLAEAFAVVDNNEEHFYEAELYRLKGELTLQQCNVQGATFKVANPRSLIPHSQAEAEAEACFLKAIDIARTQQAKSLELRAAMSLARLWQHQGKQAEARELLAPIYGWFTEGFDTADLHDAKALLNELGS